MIGYSKGGTGYVLVKVDNIYVDITEAKGIGNVPIMIDTTYQPERRVRTTGEVIQLPLFMGKQPIMQVPVGWPGYGAVRYIPNHDTDEELATALYSQGYYNYRTMEDIAPEIQVGDKLHFKWRTLFSRKNLIAETKVKDGRQWIYKVPYDQVYCAVRDGKIIPIGSHVFIDPVFEDWDEILVKTYSDVKDRYGNKILKDKKFWIQTKSAPAQKDRLGIVKHVGTPLKGDICYLSVGDKVLYKPNLKSMITVEGKKYFIMLQDMVVCKVNE